MKASPRRGVPLQDTSVITSSRHARSSLRLARAVGLVVLAAALGACATPIARSSVVPPGRYDAASTIAAEPEAAWWHRFGDPVLSDLMERAARENRDVRIAAERVRAARAGATISRSWMLPSLGLTAGRLDTGTGYDANVAQRVPDVEATGAGASVSWEVDLTGRLRAGAAAASADAMVAEDAARGVRLLVLTDVATNYFTLVGAQQQLDTVRAISAAQDETLRLVSARYRVGLASSFDVERARTAAASARAALPPLETLVAVSRHRLAVLTGDQPVHAAAIVPWTGTAAVPDVQPGQPAALLERRPDLLASRARLEAANWRRRQAAAEWFPRLFVSALFGRQSLDLNDIDLGAARFTNASGLLTMPILDWGRTRAINVAAEAAQSEAVLSYEDAIVRALEDVENALVALANERARADELQTAAAAAEAALGRARSLYERGQIDLLPLLDAQRTRLSVQVSANDSDTRLRIAAVQLYKALGGGWDAFEPGVPASAGAGTTSRSDSSAPSGKERS
jgi:NodT family efflux transporter outer membrane factor (OMF) lipoprotein